MQHDDRQRSGALRDLIESVEMIAVETLPFGGGIVVIVGARGLQHRPADSEAALLLDCQRFRFLRLARH